MNYSTYWANLYTDPIEEGTYVCIYDRHLFLQKFS